MIIIFWQVGVRTSQESVLRFINTGEVKIELLSILAIFNYSNFIFGRAPLLLSRESFFLFLA
jgi:hypothetical protein